MIEKRFSKHSIDVKKSMLFPKRTQLINLERSHLLFHGVEFELQLKKAIFFSLKV